PQFDASGFFHFKRNLRQDSIYAKWYTLFGNISPLEWWQYWNRHTHVNLNIFNSSKFKRSDYEDDKEKVVEFYNNKGYRDAKIVSDTFYSLDNQNMKIDIHVQEGKK